MINNTDTALKKAEEILFANGSLSKGNVNLPNGVNFAKEHFARNQLCLIFGLSRNALYGRRMTEALRGYGVNKNRYSPLPDPQRHYTLYEVMDAIQKLINQEDCDRRWRDLWQPRIQHARYLLRKMGMPASIPTIVKMEAPAKAEPPRQAPAALVAAFTGEPEGFVLEEGEREVLSPLLDLLVYTPAVWDNLPLSPDERTTLLALHGRLKTKTEETK